MNNDQLHFNPLRSISSIQSINHHHHHPHHQQIPLDSLSLNSPNSIGTPLSNHHHHHSPISSLVNVNTSPNSSINLSLNCNNNNNNNNNNNINTSSSNPLELNTNSNNTIPNLINLNTNNISNTEIIPPSTIISPTLVNSNSLSSPTKSNQITSSTSIKSSHPSKSIPPSLSLVNLPHKSQSDSSTEDLMTARCHQFPIEALEPPHSTLNSCRFQPYLPNLTSDNKTIWSSPSNDLHSNYPRNLTGSSRSPSSFGLEDSSNSSNDQPSSCSSISSSARNSLHSDYFNLNSTPGQSFRFKDSSPPTQSYTETLYPNPPMASLGYPQTTSSFHTNYNSSNRTSFGLVYPPNAFTPSGGSPPIPSASTSSSSTLFHHLESTNTAAGRRHTVSAYFSPSSSDLGIINHTEFDENLLKEEKRRRNKESSQRFRDRTRERQREKQERLEYLERRIKELETQVKLNHRIDNTKQISKSDESDPKSIQTSPHPNQQHLQLIESLQNENANLRRSLKAAEEEINRLQQLAGLHSPSAQFNIGHVYASLAQISPPASTDLASGSQASSPSAEPAYFQTTPNGGSPPSDSCNPHLPNGPNPIPYTSTEHLPQHHSSYHHQALSTTAHNEFWERSNEPNHLISGWQSSE